MSSRWRDRSPEGIARWGNLPIGERVSDCVWTIREAAELLATTLMFEEPPDEFAGIDMRAATSILCTISRELSTRLPSPLTTPTLRDPDLEETLRQIEAALRRVSELPSDEQERAYEEVERVAAPYALAFFYEIRILDGRGLR